MKRLFERFLKEEAGVTTTEYAIMLSLVALAVALASPNIRDAVTEVFGTTSRALSHVEGQAEG